MVSLCSSLLIVTAASSVAAFSPSQSMRAKSNAHKHHNVPLCESSNNNNSGGYLDSLSSSSSQGSSSSSSQQAANENIEYDDFDDFAGFQSAQIVSDESSEDTNQDNGASSSTNKDTTDDDTFLSSLQSRMQQFESKSNTLPLMILDTMLPRQILQIQIQHPTLKALMKHRYREEIPTLGMLGMAKLSTGQSLPLKTGVEVEIIQMDKPTDVLPSDISDNGEDPWDVSLRAGRRFIIEGNVEKNEQGWTEASVKFLDSTTEEENEIHSAFDNPNSTPTAGSSDRLSVARAISKSKQFTEPNMNMKDGASLIERWIELAKENERHPGQIDVLLQQLGEIPPEHEPTNRAMWVGALINPLPSMGVAKEIRPQLLVSKRAEERVQVALVGLLQSIKHMDGSAPMW